MNFDQLKVFHMAAIKQNFSETAKALHLSQPSVSVQIRQLEEHYQAKLFKRTTKKVTLTTAGELLFQHAEKIINAIYQTERELELLSGSVHGELVVGASLTIGEHVLPYILGEYMKEFPQVKLKLKVLNSEHIIEELENGRIHLGFIESMASYPNLTQKPFLEDELIIIASSNYSPLFINEDKSIAPADLFQLPIILREQGSGTRQVIEEHLQKNNLDPARLHVILELEHTESIKSAVESGLGVSIISRAAIHKELKLNTLQEISIEGIKLNRFFSMVYAENSLSITGHSLLSFTKKYYNKTRLFS